MDFFRKRSSVKCENVSVQFNTAAGASSAQQACFSSVSAQGPFFASSCLSQATTVTIKNMDEFKEHKKSSPRLLVDLRDQNLTELPKWARKGLHHITELNLNRNAFGDDGTFELCYALQNHSNINKLGFLNLTGNGITYQGAVQLCMALNKTQLLTLEIADNDIGDRGLQILSEALKSNTTLVHLNMKSNNVSDIGLLHLVQSLYLNDMIRSLNLSYNKITSDGINNLCLLLRTKQEIVMLDLSGNRIGTQGAKEIAECLAINQSITSLQIASCDLTDAGVQEIASMLATNRTLVSLNLTNNKITDVGANLLADCLKHNTSLVSLNLASNDISDAIISKISLSININKTRKNVEENMNSSSSSNSVSGGSPITSPSTKKRSNFRPSQRYEVPKLKLDAIESSPDSISNPGMTSPQKQSDPCSGGNSNHYLKDLLSLLELRHNNEYLEWQKKYDELNEQLMAANTRMAQCAIIEEKSRNLEDTILLLEQQIQSEQAEAKRNEQKILKKKTLVSQQLKEAVANAESKELQYQQQIRELQLQLEQSFAQQRQQECFTEQLRQENTDLKHTCKNLQEDIPQIREAMMAMARELSSMNNTRGAHANYQTNNDNGGGGGVGFDKNMLLESCTPSCVTDERQI